MITSTAHDIFITKQFCFFKKTRRQRKKAETKDEEEEEDCDSHSSSMEAKSSPDLESIGSGTTTKRSSGSRSRIRRDFLTRFTDSERFTENLQDWFGSVSENDDNKPVFEPLFELVELQKFDYALEGVSFQQLTRMPNAVYASTSTSVEANAYLAVEDFLHAAVKSLWEAFWREALFYALRVLISRSVSRLDFSQSANCVFVLLVDLQYGGVVKVEGDVSKLDYDANNVYECTADWIKNHSKISVSPIDRIWNKLGNANWRDIGALQVVFATYHSIMQYFGPPRHSIEDLAADHSSRVHSRRQERQLGDTGLNENGMFRLQQRTMSPEIVEVHEEESSKIEPEPLMKLEVGSVLWLEDSIYQKGYQINQVLTNGTLPYHIASPVDEAGKSVFLYVGSPPSQLEPALEDMNLWYQVQRQTKMLSIMRQRGLSSKYLPQLHGSGRIIHPGQCQKPSSGGRCDHPWCGTPILVTTPVGETVSDMVNEGRFGPEEAIRCCHDCLSALSSSSSAGIRHGDIRPENVVYVTSGVRQPYFVLIGWGHAVLEDRDRPAMNLHFSSTYALQEGKLCAASDAESLIYMLYFCFGDLPDLDSVEGALQWRETSWSKRLIQQKLGDVSTILKAFSDYVDSLCGTPYPLDYGIWLRRLKRNISEDLGKEIETSG
ncbi:BnaC03g23050D [Brassica napus]|uniref:BnaC03g23050D protein n=1 Tax=Brassica napus TaxID=3708 RepID=A0A078G7M9_BRANA|nr:BnaC03g23050D [Brassica napus]